MRTTNYDSAGIRTGSTTRISLADELRRRVIGQDDAIRAIAPAVELYQAGLCPAGRPAGIFLLLGPTGTGKTHTVEALAAALHGNDRQLLRIDCGEFQMEHEVAKLTGAPPGYLGHRETQPMINQQKLAAVTSERCGLSLVLFDEIEKAAPSLNRILLGILDKASLRLGDNSVVNFERSLIFLTSNLGAREMMAALSTGFGFAAQLPKDQSSIDARLDRIGLQAVRRRFTPEFVNRLDCTVTYRALDKAALRAILDQQLQEVEKLILTRLGPRAFRLEVSAEARDLLLARGTSQQSGARELKRAVQRSVVQPLSRLVLAGDVIPRGSVKVEKARGRDELILRPRLPRREAA
jgi:ATP-dependent Clp protease ATP-binding subunit ClpA